MPPPPSPSPVAPQQQLQRLTLHSDGPSDEALHNVGGLGDADVPADETLLACVRALVAAAAGRGLALNYMSIKQSMVQRYGLDVFATHKNAVQALLSAAAGLSPHPQPPPPPPPAPLTHAVAHVFALELPERRSVSFASTVSSSSTSSFASSASSASPSAADLPPPPPPIPPAPRFGSMDSISTDNDYDTSDASDSDSDTSSANSNSSGSGVRSGSLSPGGSARPRSAGRRSLVHPSHGRVTRSSTFFSDVSDVLDCIDEGIEDALSSHMLFKAPSVERGLKADSMGELSERGVWPRPGSLRLSLSSTGRDSLSGSPIAGCGVGEPLPSIQQMQMQGGGYDGAASGGRRSTGRRPRSVGRRSVGRSSPLGASRGRKSTLTSLLKEIVVEGGGCAEAEEEKAEDVVAVDPMNVKSPGRRPPPPKVRYAEHVSALSKKGKEEEVVVVAVDPVNMKSPERRPPPPKIPCVKGADKT